MDYKNEIIDDVTDYVKINEFYQKLKERQNIRNEIKREKEKEKKEQGKDDKDLLLSPPIGELAQASQTIIKDKINRLYTINEECAKKAGEVFTVKWMAYI
jgi:hypothetical protein